MIKNDAGITYEFDIPMGFYHVEIRPMEEIRDLTNTIKSFSIFRY
jgi:hypothetical protein